VTDSEKKKSANEIKFDELEATHGRCAQVEIAGRLYVFRAPTLDEWEDYQDSLGKKRRGVCFRELSQLTCVHPTLEELQALFASLPAIATRIADAVSDLAGADIELTVKKG
jgi:hypothetical protein